MKRPRPEEAGTNANSAKRPAGGASGPQRGPPVNQKPQSQAAVPAAANTAGQPQQSGLTTMDALSYLRDVKDHFKYNKAVYDSFLDIMKEFKARRIARADVIQQVKELFKGHDNLIMGFNTFVPKGAEIQLTAAERAEHAAERERQERLKAEQAPPAVKELPASQPASLPVEATKAGAAGGKRPVEYDQAFNYVNKIRTRFRYDERVYNQFLEILNMYRKGQKTISQVYAEVARLFKDHTDLLEEFTYFLPDNTAPSAGQPAASEALRKQINKRKSARRNEEMRKENEGLGEAHVEDRKPPKAANLGKELQFFEKVKTRLRNREAYQDLMKCLNIFNQEIISKSELQGLAYDIIGRFPDLMQGFNEFLLRCESMDIDLGDSLRGRDAKISQRDIAKVKQVISARERFMSKPISELDLSACERCGPSYRLLPKNFPKPSCSHRNDLCMAVLMIMAVLIVMMLTAASLCTTLFSAADMTTTAVVPSGHEPPLQSITAPDCFHSPEALIPHTTFGAVGDPAFSLVHHVLFACAPALPNTPQVVYWETIGSPPPWHFHSGAVPWTFCYVLDYFWTLGLVTFWLLAFGILWCWLLAFNYFDIYNFLDSGLLFLQHDSELWLMDHFESG